MLSSITTNERIGAASMNIQSIKTFLRIAKKNDVITNLTYDVLSKYLKEIERKQLIQKEL